MAQRNGTSGKPTKGAASPPPGEPERQAAYFLSLSLENVRCFGPKQTLDLSDGNGKPAPWTIILGLNGTGKTTLLQSLVGFEHLPRYLLSEGESEPHARFFELPVETLLNGKNREARLSVDVVLAKGVGRVPLEHGGWSLLVTGEGGGDLDSLIYGSDSGLPPPWCCAYGAGRHIGTAAPRESGFDDPTATLFSDSAELRNPEEWLIRLDYAAVKASKRKDARERLTQAKDLLLAIMPDGEITDIRLTTTSGPNPKPRAEFQTPYGWVPLRQLGYGYQTLITWVADLANRMAERYPDSANPLTEPAVVLVDEIDLHLHPKWQRKLMSFLTERFPNTQFIATAHSPLVAQAAADANLAVLRREGDHVIIDNEVDNIRNWRIDQILTSDLFGLETARPPQVEALLLERKALLTKPKQTAADKRRLTELNAQIGELPMGETTKEIEDRQKMLSLLESLAKERKPAS
ncbi:AAA family ATPase [Gemmata sp. G18]|uniref:AAA family ATPase n=1 Tax=Gemmata palustris TaxID=2822762 RepID=A0ABS5C160_9BACT|nr:AAA family ATPase [Gemmata palustris]MBP3959610.1 AAA family ATPase [Gemmata palustris]